MMRTDMGSRVYTSSFSGCAAATPSHLVVSACSGMGRRGGQSRMGWWEQVCGSKCFNCNHCNAAQSKWHLAASLPSFVRYSM